jgi:signal transduction histidine kinase
MSAAAVALAETSRYVETPRYAEAPVLIASPEERLRNLLHDLRQPLSSIEAIAYFLEMTLPAEQVEARHHLTQVQRLVADASTILERSAGPTRKARARAAAAP